jgi:putative endopeptidase
MVAAYTEVPAILEPAMTLPVLRLALCGLLAATQPQAAQAPATAPLPAEGKATIGSFGLDLSGRDLAMRPGDDFDRYASGAWDDRTTLRDDQAGFGSMVGLEENSEAQLVALMADLRVRTDVVPGSDEQKVRDLYLSFNNMAARNALGIKPLQPLLARIDGIDSMSKLIDTFGRVEEGPVRAPIVYAIGVDPKDPRRYLISVRASGLGLPNRRNSSRSARPTSSRSRKCSASPAFAAISARAQKPYWPWKLNWPGRSGRARSAAISARPIT